MPEKSIQKTNFLDDKLSSARRGRRYWFSLERDGEIGEDTFVILFPEKDSACSAFVVRNLRDFITYSGTKALLILTVDDSLVDLCEREGLKDFRCISMTDTEAGDLMAYYTLKEFTDRLVIASLSLPEGRHGMDAVGVQGITEEETVRIGILGLPG